MQKDRKSREEWDQNFPSQTGAGYGVNMLTGIADGRGVPETRRKSESP